MSDVPQKRYSAGGVVVNRDGGILVVNQDGTSWSLAKGGVEAGETSRQAAEREIREESGIKQLEYVKDLGEYVRPQTGLDGKDNLAVLKHITMFLYRTDQMVLKPEDPANPEARWVKPEDVADLLT